MSVEIQVSSLQNLQKVVFEQQPLQRLRGEPEFQVAQRRQRRHEPHDHRFVHVHHLPEASDELRQNGGAPSTDTGDQDGAAAEDLVVVCRQNEGLV